MNNYSLGSASNIPKYFNEDDELSFLSLSEKPDRTMALLDHYETKELDSDASLTDHKSGLLLMVIYDTPGVIERKMHKLDSMMMKNVCSAGINTNCAVVLVDACITPAVVAEGVDEVLAEDVEDLKDKLPILLVLNKNDLIKPGEIIKKLGLQLNVDFESRVLL